MRRSLRDGFGGFDVLVVLRVLNEICLFVKTVFAPSELHGRSAMGGDDYNRQKDPKKLGIL